MGWVIEIAKLLGYAALVSVVYVFFTAILGVGNSKATGWSLIRTEGYPLMLVGFFTVVLGFLLTRLDLVSDVAGRPHFTLR